MIERTKIKQFEKIIMSDFDIFSQMIQIIFDNAIITRLVDKIKRFHIDTYSYKFQLIQRENAFGKQSLYISFDTYSKTFCDFIYSLSDLKQERLSIFIDQISLRRL